MKDLSKISLQKKNQNYFQLTYEDLHCLVSIDIVNKYKLKDKVMIDYSYFLEIKNEQLYYNANKIALNYLNYKPRTKKEVERKLLEHLFEYNIIEKSIHHFLELNLINDDKYINDYYLEKVKLKKWSFNKIKYELMSKGIKKDLININIELINQNDNINCELILNKKYKIQKDKNKLKKYLISKGFNYELVKMKLDALPNG